MTEALLTFVQISDTHLHRDPTYSGEFTTVLPRPGVEALVRAINELPFPVDFVLHTGDIMTDPEDDAEYEKARTIFSALHPPIYYLSGNHDRLSGVQRVLLGRETLTPYLDYDFEHNGVQIVCLDSSINEPNTHHGLLEPDQLAWLERLCWADDPRPLVVAVHHHVLPLGVPWLDPIVLTNGVDLHHILLQVRHRLRGVFYGHIHENIVTTRDGINYFSVRSGWFQTRTWHGQAEPANEPLYFPGFNLVTLTTQDTFVREYRVPL